MKTGLTIALLFTALQALAQVKLDVTTKTNDSGIKHVELWAKDCNGRVEDRGPQKEPMYSIIRDCGKTMIVVSTADKGAVKMPIMESSPVPDINTGALFLLGNPSIRIRKVEEKPGETILGRETKYYRFKSTYTPDPAITQESITLDVDEEFWVDPNLNAPALESILGKSPSGTKNGPVREAFSSMPGLPLKYRRVVVVDRGGVPAKQPEYLEEVVRITTEPFGDEIFQWPKDYKYMDLSGGRP